MKTKSITIKKTSFKKIAAKLICCLVFLGIAIQSSSAQSLITDKGQQSVIKQTDLKQNVTTTTATNLPTVAPTNSKTTNINLPYYHYKGITDLDSSKKEWAKDNPEEYLKLNPSLKPVNKATNIKGQTQATIKNPKSKITDSDVKLRKKNSDIKSTDIQKQKTVNAITKDTKLPNADNTLSKKNNVSKTTEITKKAPVKAIKKNTKLPNSDRILPKNYDDSKTNSKTKVQ